MRIFRILSWLVAVLLVVVVAQTVMAQDDPNFEMGLKPFGSYHGGDIDKVNLGNGGLDVEIPLISYPQRGGKLSLDFSLSYRNKSGYVDFLCIDSDFGEDCWYQGAGTANGFEFVDKSSVYPDANTPTLISAACWLFDYYYQQCNLKVDEADGAVHQMAYAGSGSGSASWVSTDGTGYLAKSGALDGTCCGVYFNSITDREGTQYSAPTCYEGDLSGYFYGTSFNPAVCSATREDVNGNTITTSSSGWTDTVGRSIPFPTTHTGSSTGCPTTGGVPSATLPTVSYVVTWAPPGVGGGTYPLTFCYISVTAYYTPDDAGFGFGKYDSQNLLQSVVLPNNTAWTFTYTTDSLYNLSQITFPTGGTINYSWGRAAGTCYEDSHVDDYNAAVTQRVTNPNDGGVTGTWNYNYSTGPWPSYIPIATVTDPANNATVHTFGLGSCALYETETQNYNGAASGTAIKTVNTTYSYNLNPSSWSFLPFTILNAVPTNVQTTLNDTSQVSDIQYTYDTSLSFQPPFFLSTTPVEPLETSNTYGDVLTKSEYDYGSSSPTRMTTTGYLALANSSYMANNLLDLPSSVLISNSGSTTYAYTTYAYDGVSLQSSGITTIGGVTVHNSSPPAGIYRGNLTSTARLLYYSTTSTTNCPVSVSDGYLVSYTIPYDTGMTYKGTDPCGNMTQYSYDSTGTFVTNIQFPDGTSESATWDTSSGLMLSHTDQNSLTTHFNSYDSMERLTSVSFPDGGNVTYCYEDLSGGGCSSSATAPYFVFTKAINSSTNFKEVGEVDGFGRRIQAQTAVPTSTCSGGYVYVNTSYDNMGRTGSASNPYCTASDATYGVTSYIYDELSRVTKVIPPDGSSTSNNITTTYSGSCTTVTDQAGASRKSCSDGLGRMTGVWEAPSGVDYVTTYSYDPLDNLTSVSQGGSRTRTFTYDSLSRPVSASNPESGPVCYGTIVSGSCQLNGYDANGNLVKRTDARGTVTTSTYDNMNRLTQKSYSDSTPTVYYVYNGNGLPSGCSVGSFSYGSYPKGRRTAMCDAAGSEAWSYDTMGRVLNDQRTTNSITYTTTYTPNYDGSIYSVVYPSGSTIVSPPNIAAQPAYAQDTTNSINYAYGPTTCPNGQSTVTIVSLKGVCYAPQGALASLMNGSSLTTTMYYNTRLQPCRLGVANSSATTPTSCSDTTNTGNVLDFSYSFDLSIVNTPCSSGFGSPTNNGNVAAIINNKSSSTSRSQNFCYDSLNRLTKAQTTSTYGTSPANCWSEVYSIDPWGNLTSVAPPSGSYPTNSYGGCIQESGFSITVNTNNQDTGACYDAAGNKVGSAAGSPPSCSPLPTTYSYNAENEITSTAGVTYTYDGVGRRMMKTTSGSAYKLYWYDTSGNVLDETDGSGSTSNSNFNEYVFFGGKRIAKRNSSTVDYYFADHLGTARIVASSSGGTVLDDVDFYPFGGERDVTGPSSGNNYKFTGKERDTESGLDNFGARYDSSQYGRFMTPDDIGPGQHPEDPQTWNLYSYVRNNPLNLVDPTGQYICDSATVSEQQCRIFDEGLNEAKDAAEKLKDKDPAKYQDIQNAIKAYGEKGIDNGVVIAQGTVKGGYAASTDVAGIAIKPNDDNMNGQNIRVTFNEKDHWLGGGVDNNILAMLIGHEGSHVEDASAWVDSGFSGSMNPTTGQSELRAYQTSVNLAEGIGFSPMTLSFLHKTGKTTYSFSTGLPLGANNAAINSMIRREYPNANFAAFSLHTRIPRPK